MPISNRKKVRNWSRQVQKIKKYYQQFYQLPISEEFQREYAKLYLHPWGSLIKRNPPVWLQKIIVSCLIDVAKAWKEQLEKTGRTFFLQIWIYDREFSRSQVVCALDPSDWVENYKEVFEESGEPPMRFPGERFGMSSAELENFTIKERTDCRYFFMAHEAGDWTEEQLAGFRNKALEIRALDDGSESLVLSKHRVWTLTPQAKFPKAAYNP